LSVGDFRKIATIKSIEDFRDHLDELGAGLPCDYAPIFGSESPLAQPIEVLGRSVGNRFVIQPMEGWDGTADGRPTENVIRRWKRFGSSGAKLIWGGEAVAIRQDVRANPNQLVISPETIGELGELRAALVKSHEDAFGTSGDLIVGLQLTHSGRYCRPNRKEKAEPQIVYHHPILDRRLGLAPECPILSDGQIREIIADYHLAAKMAQRVGFDFVDIKHCHGYLGHEFLSAVTRPGPYGGSLENRTRFLREIVEGIRAESGGLGIGVRLSAFDLVPYIPDPDQSLPGQLGPGVFESYCDYMPYHYAFGANPDQPTEPELTETVQLFEILRELDIRLVNITAGSPYYNPHIQRPALYPPSDGYQPPEDPLIGVARQIHTVRYLKRLFPDFTLIGSAYSYLQEFLPHVAQAVVREGWVDMIGVGRLTLSYPELPADLLSSGIANSENSLQTKRLCRTFSDCTTAPRNGLVSGCYPLDPYYKKSPEAAVLAEVKKRAKSAGS
jgi:NADPH2 dehydrogenase